MMGHLTNTNASPKAWATTTVQAQPVRPDGSVVDVEVIFKRPPEVILRLGLFFDGTANHAENTKLRQQYQQTLINDPHATPPWPVHDGSYENEHTNVYKLHEMYYFDGKLSSIPRDDGYCYYQQGIYIEGVGTEKGLGDDLIGMGTGFGNRGIEAKARKAVSEIKRVIEEFKTQNEGVRIKGLEYDIFGFSRGAATARFFTNIINEPDNIALYSPNEIQALIQQNRSSYFYSGDTLYDKLNRLTNTLKRALQGVRCGDWLGGVNGRVRFLGLFDTVAGLGSIMNGFAAGNGDRFDIRIDLNDASAEHGIQLEAQHEYRKNFSLDEVPASFKKITLPGAHSDIGGGYPNQETEEVRCVGQSRIRYNLVTAAKFTKDQKTDADKAIETDLKAQLARLQSHPEIGYLFQSVTEKQFEYWTDNAQSHPTNTHLNGAIISSRKVKGGLDRIALRVMFDEAVANGCRFNAFDSDYQVCPELNLIAENIVQASRMGKSHQLNEEEKNTIRDYIHCSVLYEQQERKTVKKIQVEEEGTHEIKTIRWTIKERCPHSDFALVQPHAPRYNENKHWYRRINRNQG